jgi:hypothetical protein
MTQELYGVEKVICDVCGKEKKYTYDVTSPNATSCLESDLLDQGWEFDNGQHICPICQRMKENGWGEEFINGHESAEWSNIDNSEYLLRITREYPISREVEFFRGRDENGKMVEKEKYHIKCNTEDYSETVWGWKDALDTARKFMANHPEVQ